MIVTISRNGRTADIRMPASESDILKAAKSCMVFDTADTVFHLEEVRSDFPELKRLEGLDCDLDHLNLLARVCAELWGDEEKQFQAGAVVNDVRNLTDMINTVMNVQCFSIAQPGESLRDIGRNHYLNIHGGYTSGSISDEEFEQMGNDLLNQKGTDTPYGKVFVNDEVYERFFDGFHLPAYFDRSEYVFAVFLKNGEDSEFLMLPCENTAISRALKRLDVRDFRECTVDFVAFQIDLGDIENMLCEFPIADIFEINRLADALSKIFDHEIAGFLAAVNFIEQRNSIAAISDLADIAENYYGFRIIPDIEDEYNLGQYLIKESGDYKYDENLEDFYDYAGLGAVVMRTEYGLFTEYGYVGISSESLKGVFGFQSEWMEEME